MAVLADLHRSPEVTHEYLAEAVRRTQDLGPDLLVVLGDYSHLAFKYSEDAARLLTGFRAPMGVFSCLGNHDYGLSTWINAPMPPALRLVGVLEECGVRVLANESVPLVRGGQTLWLVGADDLWASRCQPAVAMKDVPAGAPNITLCHNPDAAEDLEAAGCGTILSGHTHGGQVQLPFIGPLRLPVVHRERYRGLYRVGRSWLYINRGLGWIAKVRFNCRPEISLLTLRPATTHV
jgi:predicted MPP superfamily phosphohydrolase